MKIIRLTASNVKRLKAVEITPDGTVQVVTGRNAQGKSSVLDAIWLALGGGAASKATARPIRDGETTASVRLDLGDLIVTRTWTDDRTTLTVTSADGARFPSPQKMLDDLVGRLSFDPLAFTRLAPAAQRDALLSLVALPFDPADLDRRRAGIYDQRTEIGRTVASLKGKLDALPEVDAPDEEVSSADVLAELRAAQARRDDFARAKRAAEVAQSARERAKAALDAAQDAHDAAVEEHRAAWAALDALPSSLPDVGAIEERLAGLDQLNAAVRQNAERSAVLGRLQETTYAYSQRTAAIEALDQEKADGLAAAAFPIDGLGFDAGGVTYNGVPFSQASSAEQIRVSLAMAMALNPTLRVVRILDGSLLDDDSMALIAAAAAEHDCQVWIERVSDDTPGAVVIEDGQVA